MRIVYFTDTFRPMLNGIVTSIETFSRELADRGHEILIVVPDQSEGIDFSYPGIEILTVKGFPAFFYPDFKITFGFTPSLIRKIRAFKPDVIHFHTQFVLGWQAIVLGKILKIPRIGTFHTFIADEGYLKIIGVENFKIFGEIGWKYNNFFYEHCECVITPSESAKRELSEHGIETEKIIVVPNPVPVTEGRRQKAEDRMENIKSPEPPLWRGEATKERGDMCEMVFEDDSWDSRLRGNDGEWTRNDGEWTRNDGENIILYVGRISREKSLATCIDAIYVVSRDIPDVRFVVVGDGPDREAMVEYAAELGISENVVWLGRIEHETLLQSDIFERSKLFLTASATETQGITLLEAMSFGLPVVGVDAKWVGEIIEDNGYKARVGNSWELALYCLRILKDPELRGRLSRRSREIVKKYDVAKLTDDLVVIYKQTIENGLRKK